MSPFLTFLAYILLPSPIFHHRGHVHKNVARPGIWPFMVISIITPRCFPPLGPEGVRVFSYHLPRQHPCRLDDDDELYRIMLQFHGVEDFLTLTTTC
jgi:hypothetical protein